MKCALLQCLILAGVCAPALAQEPVVAPPAATQAPSSEPDASVEQPAASPAPAQEPAPTPETPATTSAASTPTAEVPAAAPTPDAAASAPAAPPEVGVTVNTSVEAPAPAPDFAYSLSGAWRISALGMSELRADAEARPYGQTQLFTHRLRFEPSVTLFDQLSLKSELQLAAANLAGGEVNARFDDYGLPRSANDEVYDTDELALRKLYLDWRTPYGVLIAGRLASTWGLGLLANGGDDDQPEWGEPRYGRDHGFGDVYNRVMVATAPLALAMSEAWAKKVTVAVGADWVERDERVTRSDGDDSYQGVGVVRYKDDDHEGGAYVAYRTLEDRWGETLDVWAFDVFGKGRHRVEELEVSGAFELAVVNGTTTLARNNAFTGDQKVQQLGYVVRGGATYLPLQVGADVELGYASGDSNSNDGYVRNFSFDPEYNPSLILFDELRAAETVGAQASASDPERVGYPPDAARQLPSRGAVSNAIYVRPTARWSWRDLDLKLAALFARSEEDVTDPYNSTLVGGVARNFQGGDGAKRNLGVEVDVGVAYKMRVDEWAEVSAALQAGRLWPGEAFENADGNRHPAVNLVFGQLIVRWLPPPET